MEYLEGMFGICVPLNGRVIFAKGAERDTSLYTGVVTEITSHNCTVKCDITGRTSKKYHAEVLNIETVKQSHPEAFI